MQGEELVNYLQKDYLPTLHLSAEQSQEFCQALQTDPKTFKTYLKVRATRALTPFKTLLVGMSDITASLPWAEWHYIDTSEH